MSNADRESADLSAFGRVVEEWRRDQQVTQRVLAELVGTNQSSLSRWLRTGQLPPSVEVIVRIAKLTGANLEELILEEQERESMSDPQFLLNSLREIASPRELRRFLRQQRLLRAADRLAAKRTRLEGDTTA